MKKPKSILRTKLEDGQQAQLADWLISGVKYHEAVPMIEKEFGLQLGGGWLKQLSDFWRDVCVPHLLMRRTQAVQTSEEIAADARARPGQFDAATIDALKQKAFELSISPGANPKDVKSLFGLVLKARDQDIDERQLQFEINKYLDLAAEKMLDRALQAKANEINANTDLSRADKIAAMRQAAFSDVDALEKSGEVQVPRS